MRNPITSPKTDHRANGTIAPLKFETIESQELNELLANTKRQGIYRPYIAHVVEAIKKLSKDQGIKFHVPQIPGRTQEQNCKRLMSVINIGLKTLKINYRLRHVNDTDLLVSEKTEW